MAAASQLTILAPKPRNLQTFRASAASCCSTNSTPASHFRRQLFGLLAASAVAAVAPLEADATRIEYYATFSEPSCELNFVRSGLGYCDLVVGSGEEVPYAQLINVHYTARFADGIVFDSTYKRARPLTMRLGVGKVIKGLDQGILGGGGVPPMKVERGSFTSLHSWHMGLNQQAAFQGTVTYLQMQHFYMMSIMLMSTRETGNNDKLCKPKRHNEIYCPNKIPNFPMQSKGMYIDFSCINEMYIGNY